MSESEPELLQRLGTDGQAWAIEFKTTALGLGYPVGRMDIGWLTGWFANAIEAGAAREMLAMERILQGVLQGETARAAAGDAIELTHKTAASSPQTEELERLWATRKATDRV